MLELTLVLLTFLLLWKHNFILVIPASVKLGAFSQNLLTDGVFVGVNAHVWSYCDVNYDVMWAWLSSAVVAEAVRCVGCSGLCRLSTPAGACGASKLIYHQFP